MSSRAKPGHREIILSIVCSDAVGRAFDLHVEVRVFESWLQQTYEVKTGSDSSTTKQLATGSSKMTDVQCLCTGWHDKKTHTAQF